MTNVGDTITVYRINCRTGCTCCSYENHYRGYFETEEEAKKRVDYYLSKNSKFSPLASQYAPRGIYQIQPINFLKVANMWWVRLDEHNNIPDPENDPRDAYYFEEFYFIKLNPDGSLEDNESECLRNVEY